MNAWGQDLIGELLNSDFQGKKKKKKKKKKTQMLGDNQMNKLEGRE
jgi:hypothetical protein